MKITKAMKERAQATKGIWKDEGDGYFSLSGINPSMFLGFPLAYIKLPKGHIDFEKACDDLKPDVNGGLTFSGDGIFGWDYGHSHNEFNVNKHIKNALQYFRKRAKN